MFSSLSDCFLVQAESNTMAAIFLVYGYISDNHFLRIITAIVANIDMADFMPRGLEIENLDYVSSMVAPLPVFNISVFTEASKYVAGKKHGVSNLQALRMLQV